MPAESRALIEQLVHAALDLPLELPEIEFKQDLSFEQIQFRIAKTAMGMANRRDGGLMVIGVSQDDDKRFVLDGMSPNNAETFVQETVSEFVGRYASPPVELRIVDVTHGGKLFVAVAILPFAHTPVVCRRPTPDGTKGKDQMQAGDFYVRLNDPVRTTRVTSAEMLQDLLQLAAGRRAAEIIRTLREGGVSIEDLSAPSRFDAEVKDIDDIL